MKTFRLYYIIERIKWTTFKGPAFILILLCMNLHLKASHMMGADITYKCMGGGKYSFVIKVYRDCRGIPFNSPSMQIRCVSGGSAIITPSYNLSSIREITPMCASSGKKCSPTNTTVTSAEPLIEEHTFDLTYDFSTLKKNGCCKVQVGVGQCCRSGAITTGGGGNDFWIYSEIDLCLESCNSSPVFSYPANLIAVCNQPLNWSFNALDVIDNDSLSYSLADPLTSWSGKTTWKPGLSSQIPFTAYWPIGYDKNKGPIPNADPPVGVWLDPVTGVLTGTPNDCAEVGTLSVHIKEWRKDSTGKYQQIGLIMRDVQLVVTSIPGNNIPTLSKDSVFLICEGESLSFNIRSKDNPFVPPPPAATVQNDSVKVSWQTDMTTATITLDTSVVKQQGIKFEWATKKGEGRALPYFLNVKATDNACPFSGQVFKTYKVYVLPLPKPFVSRHTTSDSIYYTDYSMYSKQRLWFFNNVNAGSGKVLGLKRKEAEGKSVRLELGQGNCSSDTTFTVFSLGVHGLKNDLINIYPNPASNRLIIQQLKLLRNSAFEVYNSTGKLVLSGDLLQKETSINISSLADGAYFLRVKNEKMTWSFQFIKKN